MDFLFCQQRLPLLAHFYWNEEKKFILQFQEPIIRAMAMATILIQNTFLAFFMFEILVQKRLTQFHRISFTG